MKISNGFTLVELLVVIAILGGLSALLLPNFMDARQRARDAKRKNDIKQIQKALELYKLDQSPPAYISSLPSVGQPWTSFTGTIYMNKFPGDPNTSPNTYYYNRDTTLTYTLASCLENKADADGVTCPGDFQAKTGYSCSSGKCYSVIQP